MEPILSPRLLAAAKLVRQGAVLSDVGTDHALLPAYLLKEGRIKSAIASDIVKGPLQRAEETVKKYGLKSKVTTLLTPGLQGVEEYAPTDIVIAGMGGQTIAEIVYAAPFVKNPSVRLILQPMTKGELLREFLAGAGFVIEKECRIREEHRIYTLLCAHYEGTPYVLSPLELLFGRVEGEERDELYFALLEKKKEQLLQVTEAKRKNGVDAEDEDSLLRLIEKELQKQ